MRMQAGEVSPSDETRTWGNFLTFSASGFVKNLVANISGISRFFFRVYLSSTPISPGKYVLWRHGLAAQGVAIPLSLSRTTLSDPKRLVFMNHSVTVTIFKERGAQPLNPLSAATYQSPRKVLRFYAGSNLVTQSIRLRHSSQFTVFATFAEKVPSAALLEESNSRSIKLKLLRGPNLAQVGPEARLGAVRLMLNSLNSLPVTDRENVDSAGAKMRLPRGSFHGQQTKILRSFLAGPHATELLANSKFVPAHTDLNLFNIILDQGGQPRTIDFDFRRIQLLPRWFDALVLTRQCGADFFMTGELDNELAPFFVDAFGSPESSMNFIGCQREAIFDFASILLAPKVGSVTAMFPKFWYEAEQRIVYSRNRFLAQD